MVPFMKTSTWRQVNSITHPKSTSTYLCLSITTMQDISWLSLNQVSWQRLGTVWLKIHPGLVDTFLNFLHKSLNHQTPVTGTWLALERKVKVTFWKVKTFFPLLRYLPVLLDLVMWVWTVKQHILQKQPKMSLEKVVNFFLAWHLLSTARHLSYLTAHLHSQPSLINRLTCLKG